MENLVQIIGLGNVVILILLLNIIFNAVADGIRDRDLKNPTKIQGELYHMFWVLSLTTLSLFAVFNFPMVKTYLLVIRVILGVGAIALLQTLL